MGLGQTPPLVWEKFPRKVVFFLECLPYGGSDDNEVQVPMTRKLEESESVRGEKQVQGSPLLTSHLCANRQFIFGI